MIVIPATQEKLDEARTCLERLQVSGQALPLDQEEFNQRLSAFLSAAYSVVDVLKTESGKTAKGWVKQWWGSRDAQHQALHTFMRD